MTTKKPKPEIVDDLPDVLKVGLEGTAPPADLVVQWDRVKIIKAFATDETTDALIDEVVEKAKAIVKDADVETAEGRALLRTTASKLTRSKTAFDGTGKDITDRLSEVITPIMARRKKGRERFTEEARKIRDPLTKWEEKEKARIDAHKAEIAKMDLLHITEVDTSEVIQKAITDLQGIKIGDNFEEFADAARAARDKTIERLRGALTVAKGREDVERQREELARKEAEMEAERKRLAEEAAQREREAEAERQRIREEERKALEEERAQRDAELAEARKAQAEAERKAREAEERTAKAEAERKAEEERQAREQREAEEMAEAAEAKAAAAKVEAEASVGPAVHDEPMPHDKEAEVVDEAEFDAEVDAASAPQFTRAEKRAEAGRELGIRRNVYPKWVQQGRMTKEDAKRHIDLMAAIHADYADD